MQVVYFGQKTMNNTPEKGTKKSLNRLKYSTLSLQIKSQCVFEEFEVLTNKVILIQYSPHIKKMVSKIFRSKQSVD